MNEINYRNDIDEVERSTEGELRNNEVASDIDQQNDKELKDEEASGNISNELNAELNDNKLDVNTELSEDDDGNGEQDAREKPELQDTSRENHDGEENVGLESDAELDDLEYPKTKGMEEQKTKEENQDLNSRPLEEIDDALVDDACQMAESAEDDEGKSWKKEKENEDGLPDIDQNIEDKKVPQESEQLPYNLENPSLKNNLEDVGGDEQEIEPRAETQNEDTEMLENRNGDSAENDEQYENYEPTDLQNPETELGNMDQQNETIPNYYLTPDEVNDRYKSGLEDIDQTIENYRDALMDRGVPEGKWLDDTLAREKAGMREQLGHDLDMASGHETDTTNRGDAYREPGDYEKFYDDLADEYKHGQLGEQTPEEPAVEESEVQGKENDSAENGEQNENYEPIDLQNPETESGNIDQQNKTMPNHYLTLDEVNNRYKSGLEDIDQTIENYRDALMDRGVPEGKWLDDTLAREKAGMREQLGHDLDMASGHEADTTNRGDAYREPGDYKKFYDDLADEYRDYCLEGTNPNYEKGLEFQDNCQRCVPTCEARRRGEDVEAQPSTYGSDHLAYQPYDVWENPDVKATSGNGKDDIEQAMNDWGDGSRAQVVVFWDSPLGGGHTFMAEQIDGNTVYTDPQTGDKEVSRYFNQVQDGATTFCRIDNLNYSPYFNECVRRD